MRALNGAGLAQLRLSIWGAGGSIPLRSIVFHKDTGGAKRPLGDRLSTVFVTHTGTVDGAEYGYIRQTLSAGQYVRSSKGDGLCDLQCL